MATQVTPRGLVHNALKRRVIRNNPIIPAPVNPSAPASSLYDFGDVGGIADPRTARMKLPPSEELGPGPVAPPAEDASGVTMGIAPQAEPRQYDSGLIDPRDPYNEPKASAIGAPAVPSMPAKTLNTMSLEDEIGALLKTRSEVELDPEKIEDKDNSKVVNFLKGSQHAIRQSMRTGDLGFVVGAAIGGGLRGLFTKKEDEIRKNQEKAARLDAEIEWKTKQYGQMTQINDITANNEQAQQRLKQQIIAEANRTALSERRLDIAEDTFNWKKEDRDRFYELEELNKAAKNENEKKRIQILQDRLIETVRHNQALEGQGRERIAQSGQRLDLAQQKARQVIANRGAGAPKTPKGVRKLTPEQAYNFAKSLDDDFNAGRISRETYDSMVNALPGRIQY